MHTTKRTWRGRIQEGSWIERGGRHLVYPHTPLGSDKRGVSCCS